MEPTSDAFQALARSSPWRWQTLHFRYRHSDLPDADAWVRRPGELLVVDAGGERWSRHEVTARADPDDADLVFRADGLVAQRPEVPYGTDYDPMWGNYSWVAMLDPVELSHHVEVVDPRADEVFGRPAWRAALRAQDGYDPRCGGNCCELLYSEAGLRYDFVTADEVPDDWRGRDYPDHYDVALDLETGVVVRCLPVGGDPDAPWLELDILEVDADLDDLFGSGGPLST